MHACGHKPWFNLKTAEILNIMKTHVSHTWIWQTRNGLISSDYWGKKWSLTTFLNLTWTVIFMSGLSHIIHGLISNHNVCKCCIRIANKLQHVKDLWFRFSSLDKKSSSIWYIQETINITDFTLSSFLPEYQFWAFIPTHMVKNLQFVDDNKFQSSRRWVDIDLIRISTLNL